MPNPLVAIHSSEERNQFVTMSVQSGEYCSTNELFVNVLSIYTDQLEERVSESDQAKLKSLSRHIESGVDQLERGEGIEIDWDAKMAKLHREHVARKLS